MHAHLLHAADPIARGVPDGEKAQLHHTITTMGIKDEADGERERYIIAAPKPQPSSRKKMESG